MKKPNFFIVGAAKSGTTTIYHYLKDHPEIFMSDPKEPRYFALKYERFPHSCPDRVFYDTSFVDTLEGYESLFEAAGTEKVVGEASIQYMYYPGIAKDIKAYSPEAKILVILRNPVDRAFSAYGHCRRSNEESLDFEEALAIEDKRIEENYHFLWHYRRAGLYSQQVRQFTDVFDRDRIMVLLYDEIKEDLRGAVSKIFRFLEVEEVFIEQEKTSYNMSGDKRSMFLHRLLTGDSLLKRLIKLLLGQKARRRLKAKLLVLNRHKNVMKPETRLELKKYYRKDIEQLEKLLSIDLTAWK